MDIFNDIISTKSQRSRKSIAMRLKQITEKRSFDTLLSQKSA